jgi:hypothetical protein
VPTAEPVIPSVALLSVNSPQTIAQSVRNGVPVAGGPAAERSSSATLTRAVERASFVRAIVDARGPGVAHLFVVAPDGTVLGSTVETLRRDRDARVDVPVSGAVPSGSRVLMAYEADSGGTTSSAVLVR